MKGIETSLGSSNANNNILESLTSSSATTTTTVTTTDTTTALDRIRNMFQLPPAENTNKKLLDELFDGMTSTPDGVVDYCDNPAQIEVLRHHYSNEFGGTTTTGNASSAQNQEREVLKDYNEDSIIHKVVDDMPSTYRGREGAITAWHDLSSQYLQGGPCQFDLTHIKVCHNHAQVNWKAEIGSDDAAAAHHKTLFGTDSFTFDDKNHIKMQTTVALSEACDD